jgi:hypothetical protein
LGQVLRNVARMRARSLGRWEARAHKLHLDAEGALPSPEELLTFHEAQRLVAEAVAELQEPFRSTVLLCYAQEIAPVEIARRQNVPAGTVRWRLKRGLEQLRGILDARYNNDRRAWCLTLAPLAARTGVNAAGETLAGAGALALAAPVRLLGGAWGLKLAGIAALGVLAWFATRTFSPAPAGRSSSKPPFPVQRLPKE